MYKNQVRPLFNFYQRRRLRLNRTGNQHALCMLPSVEEADRLLNTQFANMQVRLLTDATAKTKKNPKPKAQGLFYGAPGGIDL